MTSETSFAGLSVDCMNYLDGPPIFKTTSSIINLFGWDENTEKCYI